jgi:hypothetical protein
VRGVWTVGREIGALFLFERIAFGSCSRWTARVQLRMQQLDVQQVCTGDVQGYRKSTQAGSAVEICAR